MSCSFSGLSHTPLSPIVNLEYSTIVEVPSGANNSGVFCARGNANILSLISVSIYTDDSLFQLLTGGSLLLND